MFRDEPCPRPSRVNRRAALCHRHRGHEPPERGNVLAMSGRAIEDADDADILMLDKTGGHRPGQPPGERGIRRIG